MTYKTIIQLAQQYDIILASGSPRRVQLLEEIPIPFQQLIPKIDETIFPNENSHQFALRMAVQKGDSLASCLTDNQLAISSDTIVILDGTVLGKPTDEQDALHILTSLSGKRHEVATAIAITNNKNLLAKDFESTIVYFNTVSQNQIEAYIATKEPMDKAGAYGIQGMGAFLVDRIDGNLDNVIGMPRRLLSKLAKQLLKQGN